MAAESHLVYRKRRACCTPDDDRRFARSTQAQARSQRMPAPAREVGISATSLARILTIDEDVLADWARLFDEPGTPRR